MILMARKWRGAINIDSIRLFQSFKEFEDYVKATHGSDRSWYVCWEVSEHSPPKRLTVKILRAVGWIK